jgi:hypothetical protein
LNDEIEKIVNKNSMFKDEIKKKINNKKTGKASKLRWAFKNKLRRRMGCQPRPTP